MSDMIPPSAGPDRTDDLIRSLVAEQKRDRKREALPELAPPAPDAPQKRKRAAQRDAKPNRQPRQSQGRRASLLKYRPKPRHIMWAALALVVVLYPLLIPLVFFTVLLVTAIVYLTLGPDRIAELAYGGWDRLARRRPQLAERLRQRADRFALRFDALLNRLPDRWAEALALPDLSRAAHPNGTRDDRPDPFDKLRPTADVYRG